MNERGSATLTTYLIGVVVALIVGLGLAVWALQSDKKAQAAMIEKLESKIMSITKANEENAEIEKITAENYKAIKEERLKLIKENEKLKSAKEKIVSVLPKPLTRAESVPSTKQEDENSKQRIEALWALYCSQSPTADKCRGTKP